MAQIDAKQIKNLPVGYSGVPYKIPAGETHVTEVNKAETLHTDVAIHGVWAVHGMRIFK